MMNQLSALVKSQKFYTQFYAQQLTNISYQSTATHKTQILLLACDSSMRE